jgi:acyl-Coa thioesterase superfamily protein/acyl-CoA thioesterase superfamily protein
VTLPTSFFVKDGANLVATALARGPWNNDHQHGGPPAALLGRAIEQAVTAPGEDPAEFVVTRVTVELSRPVPLGAVEVITEVVRAGRQAQRIAARLVAGGVEVARALGLRVRRGAVALPPARCPATPPPPGPEGLPGHVFDFFQHDVAYHRAVEIRIARGVWGQGPMAAWMRPLVPLVDGEAMSPLCRVLTVADAANGICPVLDFTRYTFINPDLTVYLGRVPAGEWIGLDVASAADPIGIGLVQGELHDTRGAVGRCLQSLVVDARG